MACLSLSLSLFCLFGRVLCGRVAQYSEYSAVSCSTVYSKKTWERERWVMCFECENERKEFICSKQCYDAIGRSLAKMNIRLMPHLQYESQRYRPPRARLPHFISCATCRTNNCGCQNWSACTICKRFYCRTCGMLSSLPFLSLSLSLLC